MPSKPAFLACTLQRIVVDVSGNGDRIYNLGGSKFVYVSTFKGCRYIGLRVYYRKDGVWMPGKKGINLRDDQFEMVCVNQEVCAGSI